MASIPTSRGSVRIQCEDARGALGQGLLLPLLLCNDCGPGRHRRCSWSSYLLHSRQALELGAAEVLLLKCCRLQHEVLLLCRVHLLQVLGCRAGLPVQGLLDHLRAGRGQEPVLSTGQTARLLHTHRLQKCLVSPISPQLLRKGHRVCDHHRNQSPLSGRWGSISVQSCTHFCLVYFASLQSTCSSVLP